MNERKNRIFTELHNLCGICGHCGKRDCAERATHSVLPDLLDRNSVIIAMERSFKQVDAQRSTVKI
jgi:hypothetical protein